MRLIDQTLAAKTTLATIEERMAHYISFLSCPKFVGQDIDGTNKDWIRTGEVQNVIREWRAEIENCLSQITVTEKESAKVNLEIE